MGCYLAGRFLDVLREQQNCEKKEAANVLVVKDLSVCVM